MNKMGVGFHLAPTVRAHLSNAGRTVWNSSTSCGEDPSRARSLGSRSSATRMVTKKTSHDHGSHCNTLNKRGSFPISRIIERKKWPKTLPLEPCPVLEVVCLSELVEQANYPRRNSRNKTEQPFHSFGTLPCRLCKLQIALEDPLASQVPKVPVLPVLLHIFGARSVARHCQGAFATSAMPWQYIWAQYSGSLSGLKFWVRPIWIKIRNPAKSIETSPSMLLVSFKGLQVPNI